MGWLGLPLAKHFISHGYKIKASSRSKSRLHELRALKIEPSILDIGALPDDLAGFLQSNILIINIPSKDIEGFFSLIKKIENSEIKKILFVSSTSVYTDQNKTIFESDSADAISNPLVTIENLFRENRHFKTTIVRFGGLIGYSRNPGKFFHKGNIVQNPDAYVNLIHRDDCIHIISRIVKQEAWGEIFNACADTHPTKREFYTQAAKNIGLSAPQFAESDMLSFKIISNQKVKQTLNYEFLHPDLMKIKFD